MTWFAKIVLIGLIVWLVFGLRWMGRSKRRANAVARLLVVSLLWAIVYLLTVLLSDFTLSELWWHDPLSLFMLAANLFFGIPILIASIIAFAIEVKKQP